MRFYLLLSTAVVLLNNSSAYASNLEVILGTHTPNLPLELKSTPSFYDKDTSFKLAAVCALGDNDCGLNTGFSKNDNNTNAGANKCIKEGYTVRSCSVGLSMVGRCPYHPGYYQSCGCPTDYKICNKPEYGVGSVCGGNMYASCQKDEAKACKEENGSFVNVALCSLGWQLKDSPKCSYNASYGVCCNKCDGYPETTISNGYVQDGTACESCWGTRYKVKANPCNGFSSCSEFGPAPGSQTCLSGTTTLYKTCKTCPNLGTLSSCPTNTICTLENCSGQFYITGCAIGAKDADSYWCNISTVKCYIPITQKCVTPPTCDDLGYKQTSSQCSGKPTLKCPFDNTKLFCLN